MPIIETTHEIKTRIQRDGTASSLTAEHFYLIAAIVAGLFAAAVRYNGPTAPVAEVIYDALRIIAAITACGYLVRSAETRTRRVLANRTVSAERARREGYAEGYVDGVARKTPEPQVYLRSVN